MVKKNLINKTTIKMIISQLINKKDQQCTQAEHVLLISTKGNERT